MQSRALATQALTASDMAAKLAACSIDAWRQASFALQTEIAHGNVAAALLAWR
jgi:hypothetical protein